MKYNLLIGINSIINPSYYYRCLQSKQDVFETTHPRHLTVIAEAYEGQVYQFLEKSKERAQDFASDGFYQNPATKSNCNDICQ